MGKTTTRRTVLLLAATAVALVMISGAALAVSKVCPAGTTEQFPCLGTAKTKKASGNDTLLGTAGPDYIKALSGNDTIAAGAGVDTTDGGAGNDTYSYKDGWGVDTLLDASGVDHLNFSAVAASSSGFGVTADSIPETNQNSVTRSSGETIVFRNPASAIEKITGSSANDQIRTGGATNTLRPGPGTGGAFLMDLGGSPASSIPASSDVYSGLSAGGYGKVFIEDFGGAADKLVLPFSSTDVYMEAIDVLTAPGNDSLIIMSSPTDSVVIFGQLKPDSSQRGHIEQIQFTDTKLSIDSETQAQALEAASTLDASEKDARSRVAKRVVAEARKKAQDAGDIALRLTSGGAAER